VIAAVAVAIWQQHRIDERERKSRQNRNIAARAMLQAGLNEICEYAVKCAAPLVGGYPHMPSSSGIAVPYPLPLIEFPIRGAEILRDCIETAEPADGRRMALCLRKLQVQRSRVYEFSKSEFALRTAHDFDSLLADTVVLHAHATSLFPYARLEDDLAKRITPESIMLSSAWACKISGEKPKGAYDYMRALGLLS
jgi:hypothetical protein